MLKTIKQITEEVFELENIEQKTRKRPYPEARAAYYAVAKETMPRVTYARIAKFLGNRHHSTAVYGVSALKDTYLRDQEFRILYQKVMDRAVIEVGNNEGRGLSEVEMLRRENEELKRKLEKCDCK